MKGRLKLRLQSGSLTKELITCHNLFFNPFQPPSSFKTINFLNRGLCRITKDKVQVLISISTLREFPAQIGTCHCLGTGGGTAHGETKNGIRFISSQEHYQQQQQQQQQT